MRRSRLILIVSACALAVPLFGASGAQADVASCAFTGAAGPITPDPARGGPETGVEAILTTDLNDNDPDDSLLGDPLTDTDSGTSDQDGTYQFDNVGQILPSLCLVVEDTNEPGEAVLPNDTGLYSAIIDSTGSYENRLCGTGTASSSDAGQTAGTTSVDITSILTPLGDGLGDDIADADFEILFVAGTGPLLISDVDDENGETGTGAGVVNILPTTGDCIEADVSQFQASGAFAVVGN